MVMVKHGSKSMKLLILDPISGDQRPYVKARITRLEPGVHLEWYTSGIVEMSTLNGFLADK